MSVKITYLVHGTTTDNESRLATGWQPGELSAAGRKQSIELGSLLSGEAFGAVFPSDLARAIESAKLAFGNKYPIIPDTRLRECNYGDLTGSPADSFKNHLTDYVETPFPGGESYRQVETRVSDFLNYLRSEYRGTHIAIVAHQAPQLALEVLLKDKTWDQAISEDWRSKGAWRPGWEYILP